MQETLNSYAFNISLIFAVVFTAETSGLQFITG